VPPPQPNWKGVHWIRKGGARPSMDSRNPSEFVEKVMAFTKGRGVDVVLNSLAGDGQVAPLPHPVG